MRLKAGSCSGGHQEDGAGVVDQGVGYYGGPVHLPKTLAFVEFDRSGVLLEDEEAQSVEASLARLLPRDGEHLGSEAHAAKTVEYGKRAYVEGARDLQPRVGP